MRAAAPGRRKPTVGIRVGFIGAGHIAGMHALAYEECPDAELYAVADADLHRARARADEWGAAKSCSDYRDLLADPAVDAVEVLLPYHLNVPVVVAALDAGKHVSVEKPMAASLQDADLMLAAAERSDRLFRVFENFRSYEPYMKAKALIDAGEIGEPLTIRVKMVMGRGVGGWNVPDDAMRWRVERAGHGDWPEIQDGGYHMASIVTYLMGGVETVHALGERSPERGDITEIASPIMISWRHAGSVRYGSWEIVSAPDLMIRTRYYPGDELVEVTGTRGIVWVNRGHGDLLGAPPVTLYRDGVIRHFRHLEADWSDSFRRAGREFIAAIRDGTQPQIERREARHVLAFSLAAIRSAMEHREVELAELDA